jgi:hypothetical protein
MIVTLAPNSTFLYQARHFGTRPTKKGAPREARSAFYLFVLFLFPFLLSFFFFCFSLFSPYPLVLIHTPDPSDQGSGM